MLRSTCTSNLDDSPSCSSEMPEVDADGHVAKDAIYYPMDYPRRGIAAIFNVNSFDGIPIQRTGSEFDVQSLRSSFTRLGFEVEVFIDHTVAELESILQELRSRDHSDADCFVLVFMSHGLEGQLMAKDRYFDTNILWEPFMADKCPSLKNKPKTFIFQACQGVSQMPAVPVDQQPSKGGRSGQGADATNIAPSYLLPLYADFLFAFSTFVGYVSWRNSEKGSWYIQSLCRHLDADGFNLDIQTLLTHVAREVALDHTYCSPTLEPCKKQLPSTFSLLIRLLKFTEKNRERGVKRRNRGSDSEDNDGDERSPSRRRVKK